MNRQSKHAKQHARQVRTGILVMQGKARQARPSVNRQSSAKLLYAMVPKGNDSVQECVHCNS